MVSDDRGHVSPPIVIERDDEHTDQTIDQPNAEIGLHPDPLRLTDDHEMKDHVLDAAAKAATTRLIHRVIEARVDALDRQVLKLSEDPDRIERANELATTAAVLLEAVDPPAARQRLNALRE